MDPTSKGRSQSRERSHLCDTHAEEVASFVTHGIGVALGVAALVVMLIHSAVNGSAWDVLSSCIFCGSMILVFLISTVYHVVTGPRAKEVMQILDRASIYLMIAGSYAPITMGVLRGPTGWWLFGIAWFLAIVGITLTICCFEKFSKVGVVLYVVMGWMVMFVFGELLKLLPFVSIAFLVAGGICYTLGLIFFAWSRLKFNHSLWHVFVVAGSMCHFVAYMSAIPTK